jgi:hypothetical protein
MPDQHRELILQWRANADTNKVREWLKERGIDFMAMHSGLLICGNKELLNQHLQISLDDITPPARIPIPAALENDVTSIMLPSPRHIHA